MNTYIAIKPFVAQQIIEMLKKLPYTEVCGLIGEINDAMNYPVDLNWSKPEEQKRKPIGFIQPQEEEEEIEYPEEEPIGPVCVCKRKRK